MEIVVLLNSAAGAVRNDPDLADRVREAFGKAGAIADVRAVAPERLGEAARAAAKTAGIVVGAGGDGTLSTIAGALAETGVAMGVLPLGTLNHFAKDLGLPLDLDGAARAIVNGTPREVDLAEVNGRVFLNNSSLGLYPRMVKIREERGHRNRLGKILASGWAGMAALKQFPTLRVRLEAGTEAIARRTPLVFVGNNRYEANLLRPASRSRLDCGELSLSVASRTGRAGIVRLAIRALFGRLDDAKDFETTCVPEVWIHTRKHAVSVATDGEVTRMKPPLHYRIRPRALRVLGPAQT